jgi:hypothetical protein
MSISIRINDPQNYIFLKLTLFRVIEKSYGHWLVAHSALGAVYVEIQVNDGIIHLTGNADTQQAVSSTSVSQTSVHLGTLAEQVASTNKLGMSYSCKISQCQAIYSEGQYSSNAGTAG